MPRASDCLMAKAVANIGPVLILSEVLGGMFARRAPGALLFYQLSRLQPQI